MARTPLFRALERSLRLARLELATGRPAAELAGEAAARPPRPPKPLTRRDFLRTASMAAAGAGLTGCRTLAPPGGGGAPEVVIAGAGIAGLTAAYRLVREGVEVRVLEAQERVGGRMFSLRGRFPDGQVVELGGELIDTGHRRIRALAGELGIPLDDLHAGDRGLAETVWHFDGRRISDAEVVAAFRPIAERIAADLASLPAGPTASWREPNGAETLDRTSLAEWLEGSGCERWLCRLLGVGYTTEYGLEPGRQSALNLLFLIDPEPDPLRIYGDSDERFHVQGGNDRITTELAGRLGDGVIANGARLEAVRERADGAFECSVRRGGSSTTVVAPRLVLAMPFTLLREVRLDLELPPVKRRAIAELGYGTNAKLMVGFDSRPWRSEHRSNGAVLTDLPLQSTWETSREQPGSAGILTNFTGGEHGLALGRGGAAAQAASLVADLERVFPGLGAARNGVQARFHWPSHPFARGSYACYLPGQWTSIAGVQGERVGNLHFAGEHTADDGQGFMEGGCESGERVAAEILADLGRGRVAA
jgi:monoamine oxidase